MREPEQRDARSAFAGAAASAKGGACSGVPAPRGGGRVDNRLPADGLWRVDAVARYLNVHRKDVYRFVATSGLPCVRMGRRLRFDPSDVLRWVSARKEG